LADDFDAPMDVRRHQDDPKERLGRSLPFMKTAKPAKRIQSKKETA